MLAYMFCDSKACTKTLDYTMIKKKKKQIPVKIVNTDLYNL